MATQSAPPANPSGNSPRTPPVNESKTPAPTTEQPDAATHPGPTSPDSDPRRWSFPAQFMLLRSKPKAPLSATESKPISATASAAPADQAKKPSALWSADRRAKQSALIVRSLIVGQDTNEGGLAVPKVPVSGAQLKNVKAKLLRPKMAGKVLAQLRALPALSDSASRVSEPIQAVCLPYTDEEADEKHLSRLRDLKPAPQAEAEAPTKTMKTDTVGSSAVPSSAIESVAEAVRNLRIVNLFKAPDLGLGQPEDGPGLLAGALPTAETVINGITQITPQLMALSYATGQALVPDHKDMHPPTDRMSVLTYWWGLEVLLPPPTLEYLTRARSISGTVMNVLTALGVMYEGVREILPFVRYFSQYIDFEFNAIKAQDHGKGVICSATWIMPAAMVPRPWDFPDPPKSSQLHTQAAPAPVKLPATAPPNQTASPAPRSSPSEAPQGSSASPPLAMQDGSPGNHPLAPGST